MVAARTSPPAMTRPDEPDFPIARLRDLVALGPLLLAGLGFWTVFALVFSIQWWLLAVPEPFPRIVADQLASWWPCALLTPPLACMRSVIAATSTITPAVTWIVRLGSRSRAGTSSTSDATA